MCHDLASSPLHSDLQLFLHARDIVIDPHLFTAGSMLSKASALSHGLVPNSLPIGLSLAQTRLTANSTLSAILLSTTINSVTYEPSSLLGENKTIH